MKQLFFMAIAVSAILFSCNDEEEETISYADINLDMGANYAQNIYFNLSDNSTVAVPSTNWDIAFAAPVNSATIITNEGAGIKLYAVGGLAEWSKTFDVTGEKAYFNNQSDWNVGAFNQSKKTSDPFNYGWGTYNPQKHLVGGDSIYVLKLQDGKFKKFQIVHRNGQTNTYIFKFADMDGANEVLDSVAIGSDATRNFKYYSVSAKKVVDQEPEKGNWDLVFTTYFSEYAMRPAMTVRANPATTIENYIPKQNVAISVVTGVATSEAKPGNYENKADAIGSGWRTYNPQPPASYTITDKQSYFVTGRNNKIYHLYFISFEGNATGKLSFKVKEYK